MTISQWLAQAEERLSTAGVSSARLDAQLLVAHVLGVDRSYVIAHPYKDLSQEHLALLRRALSQRQKRLPLAYLMGFRDFYGLPLRVNSHVLIPRPETETLVEHAAQTINKQANVLEIGTGSGAIAIALKKQRPDLSITATEISKAALHVATKNALEQQTDITFMLGDLFEPVQNQSFAVILANLPYVPLPARRQPEITFEPDVALFGGQDGLDLYRQFFKHLTPHLEPGGGIIIEASPTQFYDLQELASQKDLALTAVSEYIFSSFVKAS